MGVMKLKTEGGQGGRRGHSNMAHWVTTEEIKEATRSRRRREGKELIAREIAQLPAKSFGRRKNA